MKNDEAIKIAKSKKTSAEQLKPLLGISDEVDLLLAKHPNSSPEMLDDICERQSFDEKIASAALAHPNISVEQVLNVGWEYPLALYKNPALPAMMLANKNLLGNFDGEAFENSFKKELPTFVVDWLLSQGKAEYQVAYVGAPKRAPEVLEKFRESKHPKVVATLLEKDIDTYLAWAADIGLDLSATEQMPTAEVRSHIDLLVDRVSAEAGSDQALAQLTLPESLRNVLKQVEGMYFKGGRVTFGEGQTFYLDFLTLIQDFLKTKANFTKLAAKVVDFDLAEIKRFGNPGKKPPPNIGKADYYAKSGLEKSFKRLMVALASCCQSRPETFWAELSQALDGLVSGNPLPSADDQFKLEGNVLRTSKHPQIALELLEVDEPTYLAWAEDLGFELPAPKDGEEISPRREIDNWIENLGSQNQGRWEALVPASGSASTLQGEVIRALGRIESEYFRNGMMNWGDGSNHYENFAKLIQTTLKREKSFSKLVLKIVDADIAAITRSGEIGKALAANKKPREDAFSSNFFVKTEVEKSHQRLGALISLWCERNPAPLPYQNAAD